MLARDGTLSEPQHQPDLRVLISPARFTDRIDHIEAQVKGEIDQVMAMIGAATGSTSSYTEETFTIASRCFGRANDGTGLRMIIEGLVKATPEIHQTETRTRSRPG